jgi:hypothetical protein
VQNSSEPKFLKIKDHNTPFWIPPYIPSSKLQLSNTSLGPWIVHWSQYTVARLGFDFLSNLMGLKKQEFYTPTYLMNYIPSASIQNLEKFECKIHYISFLGLMWQVLRSNPLV